jgi:transcriptional regulator of acetoin/glycerol metabolism
MIKRLIILHPGMSIYADDIKRIFPLSITPSEEPAGISTLNQAERNHIIKALTTTKGMVGGKKGAAGLLGIPRSTLQYRMKKLNISPVDFLAGGRNQ